MDTGWTSPFASVSPFCHRAVGDYRPRFREGPTVLIGVVSRIRRERPVYRLLRTPVGLKQRQKADASDMLGVRVRELASG